MKAVVLTEEAEGLRELGLSVEHLEYLGDDGLAVFHLHVHRVELVDAAEVGEGFHLDELLLRVGVDRAELHVSLEGDVLPRCGDYDFYLAHLHRGMCKDKKRGLCPLKRKKPPEGLDFTFSRLLFEQIRLTGCPSVGFLRGLRGRSCRSLPCSSLSLLLLLELCGHCWLALSWCLFLVVVV